MDNILIERINQRLAALDKSVHHASVEATGAKETLRKIVDGTTKNPRIDTVRKIATALETTAEWLMGLTNVEPDSHQQAQAIVIDPTERKTAAPSNPATGFPLQVAPVQLPTRHDMPNDVIVRGTAAGSHLRGAFQIFGDVIDYVRRPPALMGARDVYALYVEGSSMEPQYFPGDLVYVHPGRPPRAGDVVIVQVGPSDENIEATIGIYRKQTANHFTIYKHNPAAEVSINRETIRSIHKVLSVNELFGV
jgi:phage repressor protein C with HTH and peptisase S24 domain